MVPLIEATAARILEQMPDVVVRYRLLRDVLEVPSDSPELRLAKEDLKLSRWVQELGSEQWVDGGWGRFHSRDTRLKQKIITTEAGVERGLALGLDVSHLILKKASDYILAIMKGELGFPDPPEVNDRWRTGKRLFLASTLSLISPDHPELDDDRALWCEIAKRTFMSGDYNEADEINAHDELTGASVKDSYLVISNKYALNILGSIPGVLPEQTESALLRWVWCKQDGIGYLGVPLSHPPRLKSGLIDRWLLSLEMLSRCFPNWLLVAHSAIEWLWNQRNEAGYWDFGPRPGWFLSLPLSDHWRVKRNRQIDWTTRVLILLRTVYKEEH